MSVSSLLSHFTAALIGGTLALAGWSSFADRSQSASAIDAAGTVQLVSRIDGLESRLAALKAGASKGSSGAVAAKAAKERDLLISKLRSEFQDMKQNLAQMDEAQKKIVTQAGNLALQVASGARTADDYNSRLTGLEDNFKAISEGAVKNRRTVRQMAVLTRQITKAEQRINAKLSADLASARKELEMALSKRLEAVSKRIEKGPGAKLIEEIAAAGKSLGAQTAKLGTTLDALRARAVSLGEEQARLREDMAAIREAQTALRTDMAQLKDADAKLGGQLAALDGKLSKPMDISAQMAPFTARIETLKSDIEAVRTREEKARAEGRKIALAIALANLRRVVDQGLPYASELKQLRLHAPEDVPLDALEGRADRGLPTMEDLKASFPQLARRTINAAYEGKSASFLDQILARTRSLVRVRKTGMVEGDSVADIISRMEFKLMKEGDLGAVISEAGKLTGPARKAADGWLARAQTRIAGMGILNRLESRIIGALGGAPSQ